MWPEDEDFSQHDYYNSIPGKEPPVGGLVDSRLRPSGALLGHIHTQPQSKTAAQVKAQAQAASGCDPHRLMSSDVMKSSIWSSSRTNLHQTGTARLFDLMCFLGSCLPGMEQL